MSNPERIYVVKKWVGDKFAVYPARVLGTYGGRLKVERCIASSFGALVSADSACFTPAAAIDKAEAELVAKIEALTADLAAVRALRNKAQP